MSEQEKEEMPAAAEVILTDASPELRKVEVADHTSELLEVGDKLVKRKDHVEDKEKALKEQREHFKSKVEEAVKHELEKVRDTLLTAADQPDVETYKHSIADGLNTRIENLEAEQILEEVENQ